MKGKSTEICGTAIFSYVPLLSFFAVSITFAPLPAEASAKAGRQLIPRQNPCTGG